MCSTSTRSLGRYGEDLACKYLQAKGYKLSNRNGDTCYRIDDYKLLFLKFDGTRVVNMRMDITSAAQSVE